MPPGMPTSTVSAIAETVSSSVAGARSRMCGNPLPHILERAPATLLLTVSAIALTVLVGIPGGILAASFQNRWPDLAVSGGVVALLAVPNFWLGMMLIALLSVRLGWLPSLGLTGPASLLMPTLALAARL